ncbi:hypothetical protein [Cloacibacterium caeni]|jgi:maltodextrin utilization protein YvdJ|uniref:hypothetical protein n=1 Tax=Cloacibacterium caeni TaxID=2004710 RepID=UPI001BCF6511|nr:hypothetical protein [Cloacibacterium caeni]
MKTKNLNLDLNKYEIFQDKIDNNILYALEKEKSETLYSLLFEYEKKHEEIPESIKFDLYKLTIVKEERNDIFYDLIHSNLFSISLKNVERLLINFF